MCCFARLEKNMECYLLKVVLLHGCFHVFYIVQMVQNHVQLLKYFIKTNRQWHKVCSSQVWLLGIFSCESAFRGYCAPVRGDYSLARNVWNGGKIGGGEGGGGVETFDIYFCVLFGSYCQSLIFVSTSKLEVFLKFPDFLRSYDFSPLAANLPSWLY